MSVSNAGHGKTPWSKGRRWLYVTHRWIGILTCLWFAIWFFSGVVMMYVPFPTLTTVERLRGLSKIDWGRIRIEPDAVLATVDLSLFPREMRLEMLGDTPVYRIIDRQLQSRTISATDATQISYIDPAAAGAIARRFVGGAPLRSIATVERDQWSVAGSYDAHRPLYVAAFADAQATHLYVSSRTGEIVLDTTARERFWNWLGAVPHWIYFTSLRKNQPAWRQVIIWTSGVGIVGAVTGFWVGILRLRLQHRYRRESVTPYRSWMKWHHIAGLLGGAFLLTWIVSGYLSVNPNRWFEFGSLDDAALLRYAGHEQPNFPLNLAGLRAAYPSARQARFAWLNGRPLVLLTDAHNSTITRDPQTGNTAKLADAEIFEAAQQVLPDARITAQQRLSQEDRYWYSPRARRPLPVLRVAFDDDAKTWLHLHPSSGQILGTLDRTDRAYRWWFDALHTLDYQFLLRYRPAWDVVVWLLSSLGLITSISGIVIGWRRLRR